tara:strand:+ start:14 stop:721 length:708 start_codon:yes stop_codon:yes gene_type:complete
MNLPVLNTPNHEMTIPSTGEKVTYRPFLVKEQKILMMAQESGDETHMIRSIGDIVKSCTFGKIDNPNKLPTFDLEYMFLMIRAKSVGSEIELKVTCPDDEETVVDHKINLDDIKVQHTEGHNKQIMLTDEIGLEMNYPSMEMVRGFAVDNAKITELSFELIRNTIKNVFDKEQVYDEMSAKDLDNFIEQMTTEQFEKVSKFFETMPKLSHTVNVTNPNTGVENKIVLEGLQSFLE